MIEQGGSQPSPKEAGLLVRISLPPPLQSTTATAGRVKFMLAKNLACTSRASAPEKQDRIHLRGGVGGGGIIILNSSRFSDYHTAEKRTPAVDTDSDYSRREGTSYIFVTLSELRQVRFSQGKVTQGSGRVSEKTIARKHDEVPSISQGMRPDAHSLPRSNLRSGRRLLARPRALCAAITT